MVYQIIIWHQKAQIMGVVVRGKAISTVLSPVCRDILLLSAFCRTNSSTLFVFLPLLPLILRRG